MPGDENPLGFEDVLSLEQMLDRVVPFMRDFGPHIVHHERLSEVVFIVREGHRLEVESHKSSAFDVSNLVIAGRRVHVRVEEFRNRGPVLREVGVVEAAVPLLVVVDDVVCFRGEEGLELLVLENLVEDPDFVHDGLGTLVSDARQGHHAKEGEMDFPEKSLIEHQEGEGRIANEAASPAIIRPVKPVPDLVEVVCGAHAELPHVIVEDVVAPSKLVRIPLGLVGLGALDSSDVARVVDVDVVDSRGGPEPFVVVARRYVLPEGPHGDEEHRRVGRLGQSDALSQVLHLYYNY